MRLRSVLIGALALALLAPAVALASGRDVIKDCAEDGVIDGDYSQREYEEAMDELPSDIDEYTDCREAIRGELTPGGKDRRGGSGGSGGGGSAGSPPSREDVEALGALARSSESGDSPALRVGGRRVTPGDPSSGKLLGLAGTGNELPAPVLSVLVLLLLGGAAGAYFLARNGMPAPVAARLRWLEPMAGRTREALARLLRR